jgi:large repetitive protein
MWVRRRAAFSRVLSLQNIHEQPRDPQFAEIYDPGTTSVSGLPGLTLSRRGYTATLLANGKVLLVGGENLGTATRTAELLDAASGSLDPTGELVTARTTHTATLLQDGRVLVTGGTDINGNVLATAELYK